MSDTMGRIRRKIYREYKEVCHRILEKHQVNKTIVFIVGCQRSGTTMLSKIFEADYNTKVYPEVSQLSTRDPNGRRLDPMPMIEKEIMKNNIRTIVAKPLVDSQNIVNLLNHFENSKAIWMFRHYKDVASSDLKKFGPENGIDNLRKLLHEKNDIWRSEGISEDTLNLIKKLFKDDMSPYDAGALFWYSRNVLFFELDLANNERVIMCKYEDLVSAPQRTISDIYKFLAIDFPKKKIASDVHQGSVRKGKSLDLSPEIEELCENLLNRLQLSYNGK
ncbi:sulfotransferase family protein [Maribacter sp. 2307UL18-2]|uniref:sulfotransferase family protein n=1 Tax=Maribacter sp. 2307UL18-2 TaxID=3386274 RepID=UPI0039BC6A03